MVRTKMYTVVVDCRVLRRGRDKGKKYIIRAKGRGEEGKVEVG